MTGPTWHAETLTGIGALLASGEVSAVALTEHMLDRIARLDDHVGAFATVTASLAHRQAVVAERELRAGIRRGPLHGVPIAVKELFDVRGVVTGAGMPLRAGQVATSDAEVVRRLSDAGAIVLGTLTMTEGAYFEHHPDVRPPRNPVRDDLWPGASSSGSGVAVAARFTFAALGTDTGGSIRFPAAANGIVGLKPTRERISRAGSFGAADSLDHVGTLTRSVADAAALFAVLADESPHSTAERAATVRGLRVGVDARYVRDDVHPDVVAAIEDGRTGLTRLGADARTVRLPDTVAVRAAWLQLCASEAAHTHRETYPRLASRYGALGGFLDLGRRVSAAEVAAARRTRAEFTGRLDAVFDDVDLLMVPTQPSPAVTMAEMDETLRRDEGPGDLADFVRFATPFDMSGHPTLTMPAGATADGRPLSFQLVAARHREAALLRAGHVLEQRTGRPPGGGRPVTSSTA